MSEQFKVRDFVDLVLLSAIWGASFLFLRVSSPVFGPVFLIEMRVLTALVFLLPVFIYLGKFDEAVANWRIIFLVSLTNMSLPFCLLAFATLEIGAGYASVLNATVPFFTALLAFLFWSQKLSPLSIVGMFVGFFGVIVLVFDPSSAGLTSGLSIAAGLLASLLYGLAANIASQKLAGVSGLAITVGGLFFSAIFLLPFAIILRPDVMPSGVIWLNVLGLGVVCTGVAYLLFYGLIARVGSYRAVTSTFLIPLFSIFWGYLFLGEKVSLIMIFGCLLVLFGVATTTGRISQLVTSINRNRDV